MKVPEIVYWDSDCFLGWFQGEDGKVDHCAASIERAEAGQLVLVTSALTIAEVLWMRNAPRIIAEKARIVRAFFKRPYIRVRNVTRLVAEAAQDLVWEKDVRPKDAIHVATALEAQVMAFETFDEGLIKKSETLGHGKLIVRKPRYLEQDKIN